MVLGIGEELDSVGDAVDDDAAEPPDDRHVRVHGGGGVVPGPGGRRAAPLATRPVTVTADRACCCS